MINCQGMYKCNFFYEDHGSQQGMLFYVKYSESSQVLETGSDVHCD